MILFSCDLEYVHQIQTHLKVAMEEVSLSFTEVEQ